MSYKWNHNFPQLARESGFTLREIQKNDNNIDWRFIASIEPHNIVFDKEYEILEDCIAHISEVSISFILNNRILDPAIGKYFILSQYSMQYLLFCKKFLDKSLIELRSNVTDFRNENEKLENLCLKQNSQIQKLNDRLSLFDESSCYQCENCNNQNSEKFVIGRKATDNIDSQLINTIKLELEVKQLKERLNIAEKELGEQKNKIDTKCSHCVSVEKIPKIEKEFHNVAIQSNLEDDKEKSEEHLISKSELTEVLNKQIVVFDEWKSNERQKFNEQITALKSQLNKTLELLQLKEEKVEQIEKQMESRHNEVQEKHYDEKVSKVSDKLDSMYAHQREMIDTIKKMDVMYADKIKTIENTIEVIGDRNTKRTVTTDDVSINTSPIKLMETKRIETLPGMKIVNNTAFNLKDASRRLELNTSTSTDEDKQLDSLPRLSKKIISVQPKIIKILPLDPKVSALSNEEVVNESTEVLRQNTVIHKSPIKIIEKVARKDVWVMFQNKLNSLGISPSAKKLSSSNLELAISKLAEKREVNKKKYKTYFILRNKLASDIDKIAREKTQTYEPVKNVTISKNITKPRIPITSTPIVGSKKIKTSLVLNVLPTKPKMIPVTKAVHDISPIKMFEEEITGPTKITKENLIEEVLIHQPNFPIETHDNNCEDNVKSEIKTVLPTSINKGGILEKILESPIRRLNSNSSSIDLMAIQSIEESKPTTNQHASDDKNQFTRKRVIFNLEPPNIKPILPDTLTLNDDSDWNISSFED